MIACAPKPKMPWGSVKAFVATLEIGSAVPFPEGFNSESVRASALRGGIFISIQKTARGEMTIRRLAAAKWGRLKARVCALAIGETIIIKTEAKALNISSCAWSCRVKITRKKQPDGSFALTRLA